MLDYRGLPGGVLSIVVRNRGGPRRFLVGQKSPVRWRAAPGGTSQHTKAEVSRPPAALVVRPCLLGRRIRPDCDFFVVYDTKSLQNPYVPVV